MFPLAMGHISKAPLHPACAPRAIQGLCMAPASFDCGGVHLPTHEGRSAAAWAQQSNQQGEQLVFRLMCLGPAACAAPDPAAPALPPPALPVLRRRRPHMAGAAHPTEHKTSGVRDSRIPPTHPPQCFPAAYHSQPGDWQPARAPAIGHFYVPHPLQLKSACLQPASCPTGSSQPSRACLKLQASLPAYTVPGRRPAPAHGAPTPQECVPLATCASHTAGASQGPTTISPRSLAASDGCPPPQTRCIFTLYVDHVYGREEWLGSRRRDEGASAFFPAVEAESRFTNRQEKSEKNSKMKRRSLHY